MGSFGFVRPSPTLPGMRGELVDDTFESNGTGRGAAFWSSNHLTQGASSLLRVQFKHRLSTPLGLKCLKKYHLHRKCRDLFSEK